MDFIILYIKYNNNYYKKLKILIKKRVIILSGKYQSVINN